MNELEKINNFENQEKERKKTEGDKSVLMEKLQLLLKECKDAQSAMENGTKNSLSGMRESFNFWLESRRKLEVLEEKCYELKLDYFDKAYLKKIIKIICDNLLKLFSPPKRKYALKLLENFKIPSINLNWENLNAFSSPFSLSVGDKKRCATCAKKINWFKIFSKKFDQYGNQFCEKKCFDKFCDLYCDKCNERKVSNPSYFINEGEKEGIICFRCSSTECLQCHKFISHSSEYLKHFFPRVDSSEEQNFSQKEYFPLCRSCQMRKINP